MAVHQPPLEDIESKARASIVNCAAPADHNILAGKHVFITGGASGLGKAYARAAASHGARVTIADVNAELGEQVVAEAVKEGLNLRFVSCDVMSYQSQLAAFKEASKAAPLDHVIANAATAGHWFTGPPFDLEPGTTEPEEPQLGSIRSALIGSYYTTYLACYFLVGAMAGPQLNGAEKWSHQQPSRHATSRAKSLLLIGSIGSYARVAGRPDYAAAKAGVRSIFKNIRTAIGQQTGLRINMLAPGYIKTAMNEKVVPRIEAQGFRFIEMHHAVDAVLRLLSDQQIHGRSIAIGPDGPHDMRDDPEGRDGGDELHKMFQSGEIPTTAAV